MGIVQRKKLAIERRQLKKMGGITIHGEKGSMREKQYRQGMGVKEGNSTWGRP